MKQKIPFIIVQLIMNIIISYLLLLSTQFILKLFNIGLSLTANICMFILFVVLLFLINFYVAFKIGGRNND